ncbi:MAG: DUF5930 domain-containing protein, partial [Pseudomonadota bacterium]
MFTTGIAAGVASAGAGFWLAGGLSARTGEIVKEVKVAALERQLTRAEAARAEAERRRDAATQRLAETHLRLMEAETAKREAEGTVGMLSAARERDAETRRALSASLEMRERDVAQLTGALAAAEVENTTRQQAADRITEVMADVVSERDFALARTERLTEEVDTLEFRLAARLDREERLLADLEAATRVGLTGLERLFQEVDMDVDAILSSTGETPTGQGGPLTEISAADSA